MQQNINKLYRYNDFYYRGSAQENEGTCQVMTNNFNKSFQTTLTSHSKQL